MSSAEAHTDSTGRWPAWRARRWAGVGRRIRGCNYVPATAVNATEMWQAETFDPITIERELGWAKSVGLNSLRVFIPYAVWESDGSHLKQRVEDFLAIAHRCDQTVMPVLFDDVAFSGREPYLGPQADPLPSVHNSAWTPSPGQEVIGDRTRWHSLEAYVTDIVGSFANDARVVAWDIYNEPGNFGVRDASWPLVEAAFDWARRARPAQPLTAAEWVPYPPTDWTAPPGRLAALSDIVSFHAYEAADDPALADHLEVLTALDRPLLCTEWLHRSTANTIAAMLPLFERHRIGWYLWGLVAGRTQTHLPWASMPVSERSGGWQHDLLQPDGSAYDEGEVDTLRRLARQ